MNNTLRNQLLSVARESIRYGLDELRLRTITATDYAPELQQTGASFVTLTIDGQLRGCIGSLEATQALVCNVNRNAWSAAFRDPRFNPLEAHEYERIRIHISILEPRTPLPFNDENDLLEQLRPGTDGLVLELGPHQATFLPSVWESLPTPQEFLQHLKRKAGITADMDTAQMQAWRYTTEQFAEDD